MKLEKPNKNQEKLILSLLSLIIFNLVKFIFIVLINFSNVMTTEAYAMDFKWLHKK